MPCNNRLTFNNRPDRICLMAKRVFDACQQRITRENESLTVVFPEVPAAFVDAYASGNGTISGVSITPSNVAGCSRVRFTLTVPISVVALNESGDPILGETSVQFDEDLLMRTPQESIIPAEVVCTTCIRGYNGSLEDTTLTITLCITLIIRIVADVDIVVPICGTVNLPPCQQFDESVCTGFFSLPLYPVSNP